MPSFRYQYTLYKEAGSGQASIQAGHQDVDINAVTFSGSSTGSFELVAFTDAPLPAGRYTVS